jgi:hypothetical protein
MPPEHRNIPSRHATTVAQESARRLVPSLDFVGTGAATLDRTSLTNTLQLSAVHFYSGLLGLKTHLSAVLNQIPDTILPSNLIGTLLQPDGHPAVRLHIEADLPGGARGEAAPGALTADDGSFTIKLPPASGLDTGQNLPLVIRGIDGTQTINLTATQIGSTGLLGALQLPARLGPLPISIVASLEAILSAAARGGKAPPPPPVSTKPLVKLGEGDDVCTRLFGSDAAVGRFPYSVLFRLVARFNQFERI